MPAYVPVFDAVRLSWAPALMSMLPIELGLVAASRLVSTNVHPLQLTCACAPMLSEPPSMMIVLLSGKLVVPLMVSSRTQYVPLGRPAVVESDAPNTWGGSFWLFWRYCA